ncbi:hypothetical protein [Geotalea sp. SG265]|uniref:hypothetical protein n=1 Tax=Geotalea sp. SG265 TaxID=2922867 RepID=UPI001FAF386A|nr:hypothetical protein [Geotalea sp. SG265]
MKRVSCLLLLWVCLIVSGCVSTTPPVVMDNGISRKTITRCDNDVFCFRKPLYDVTWESWCQEGGCSQSDCGARDCSRGGDFPVSYRSNEYVYADDPHGYTVTLPAGGNTKGLGESPKGDMNE